MKVQDYFEKAKEVERFLKSSRKQGSSEVLKRKF